MLKKLIMKFIGKEVAAKWNLKDETAPAPGQVMVSVPWYRSKAKIGFTLTIAATCLKYGPQLFGKPPVEIPQVVLSFLQELGVGVGGYGLRDAIKKTT